MAFWKRFCFFIKIQSAEHSDFTDCSALCYNARLYVVPVSLSGGWLDFSHYAFTSKLEDLVGTSCCSAACEAVELAF
jgi:hypothetical protein